MLRPLLMPALSSHVLPVPAGFPHRLSISDRLEVERRGRPILIIKTGSVELQVKERPIEHFIVDLPLDADERAILIDPFRSWLQREERSVSKMQKWPRQHLNWTDAAEGQPH